jgi:hypothetical protein
MDEFLILQFAAIGIMLVAQVLTDNRK